MNIYKGIKRGKRLLSAMQNKFKDPQELEVFFILPTIRKNLAKSLHELGLGQRRIAELLHLTEPAISQYLNNRRAKKEIPLTPEMQKEIKLVARRLQKENNIMKEIQHLLKKMREQRITCKLCQSYLNTKEDCKICS